MATVNLTAATFADTIRTDGIVLVDWWAEWCGPCRMFAPVFEKAAHRHHDIVFAKIDTEAEQVLAAQAGITSIPTLMAFRDGILVFSRAGALPAATLDQVIAAVQDIDMDKVREELAAQSEEPAAQPEERARR